MPADERRRDVRARISLPTAIVRRGAIEEVEMVDASFRGLFVRVSKAPNIRELIKLRIKLPGRELEAHAVVVRFVDDNKGSRGVGLRFFAMNGADRTDWEAFIAGAIAQRLRRAA